MFPTDHFNKTSSGDNTIQEEFVHNLLSNDVDLTHLHRRCKVFKNVTFAKTPPTQTEREGDGIQ